LHPTSGNSNDFAYGELGVAAYTLELGTDFFQDCDSFTNTILPENFPALLYAMKSSRAPYQLPAGPEVIEIHTTVNEASVTLTATADDGRYSTKNGAEASQNVVAAEVYLDTPPWELGAVAKALSAVDGRFDGGLEPLQATTETAGLSQGQHTLYVRAKDSAGHWGVVSAVFITVQ
jgi:carboxypeptidase T